MHVASVFASDHWSKDVPAVYQNLHAAFDDAVVHGASINFFATKNVFAGGGEDIIALRKGEDGFKTPHDVLLLGEIVEGVKKRK